MMPISDIEYTTQQIPPDANLSHIVSHIPELPFCGPRPDALGNMQSVFRIDPCPEGGFTLTYPAEENRQDIVAVIVSPVDQTAPRTPWSPKDLLEAIEALDPMTATIPQVIEAIKVATRG